MPFIIEITDSGSSPYIFGAIFGFCQAIGILIFLHITSNLYKDGKERKEVFASKKEYRNLLFLCFKNTLCGKSYINTTILKGLKLWYAKFPFIFVQIGRFGILLFALSTGYVDTIIATLLFAMSSWWFVLLRWLDGKRTLEKNKSLYYGRQTYFFLLFAILGVFFVNYSESGTIEGTLNGTAILGVAIALIAGFCDGLNQERSHKFGETAALTFDSIKSNNNSEMSSNMKMVNSGKSDKDKIREKIMLDNTLLSVAITTFITGVVSLIIYVILELNSSENAFEFSYLWIFAILFTLVANPAVTIFKRIANNVTNSLEINSIPYATPMLAMFLLLVTDNAKIQRLDLLLLGASIIIAINIIINIRTEEQRIKLGFKWLLILITIFGTSTFLRDPILESWRNSTWLWDGNAGYYALLGLSATIFVFVLGFRRQKLMELIGEEERTTLSLYYNVGFLMNCSIQQLRSFIVDYFEAGSKKSAEIKTKVIERDTSALESIIAIDRSLPGTNLENERIILENTIEKYCRGKQKETKKLELFEKINYLFHLKSKLRDATEMIILSFMAFMTILLALSVRPNLGDWSGFIYDIFVLFFSSTIAVLTISQFDLRRERGSSVFIQPGGFGNTWINSIIPSCLCLFLITIFIILFYGKWLSDWSWAMEVRPTKILNNATLKFAKYS